MLGESEFTSMYHQGKRRNTFVAAVDDSTIVTLLFDKRTTLEKVKIGFKQHLPELQKALTAMYSNFESDPELNIDLGRHT
jgi:hypothetical protein